MKRKKRRKKGTEETIEKISTEKRKRRYDEQEADHTRVQYSST
jgi:hypothetical protein